MMSWHLKRPSAADTEEDLLHQQQEFLEAQSKQQRDVQQEKRSKNFSINNFNKKQCIYAEEGTEEEVLESQDNHITKVLTSITERDFSASGLVRESKCRGVPGGFPTAFRRSDKNAMPPVVPLGEKKKSLFAMQFALRSEMEHSETQSESISMSDSVTGDVVERCWPEAAGSRVIEHSRARTQVDMKTDVDDDISKENKSKLAEMSAAEILKQQQELLNTLDPSVVAFLKSRKQSTHPVDPSVTKQSHKPIVRGQPESKPRKDLVNQIVSSDILAAPDLPIEPRKEWVHMDQIEHDKLAWMKELPAPPSADHSKTGQPARFDFEGRLVVAEADIPVHLGLHHHGLEPERAGYSLEELFQLCRSINVPQRSLALGVISKIIKNARRGEFYSCLSTCIIPSLIDGGLVFILRWALDDSIDNSLISAISTLHALLVSTEDEDAADKIFSWYPICTLPCTRVLSDDESSESKAEENDADAVKRDVIEGLLRMSLLERLCYIMNKCRLPPVAVLQIVQILTRVARHSTESAYKVFSCSKLLDVLFKEFLPLTWPVVGISKPISSAYGFPLPAVMKLARVIAVAGRNMASILISKYNLMNRVLRYLSQLPSELLLPAKEAHRLCVESWNTWQTLLQYGLGLDCYQSVTCLHFFVNLVFEMSVLSWMMKRNQHGLFTTMNTKLFNVTNWKFENRLAVKVRVENTE